MKENKIVFSREATPQPKKHENNLKGRGGLIFFLNAITPADFKLGS